MFGWIRKKDLRKFLEEEKMLYGKRKVSPFRNQMDKELVNGFNSGYKVGFETLYDDAVNRFGLKKGK